MKLRPHDAAGVALLDRIGGRIYQRCSGLCPDPASVEVRAWAAGRAPLPGITVAALAEVPRTAWAELWVRQYLWVHRDWSPAAEGPLREVAQGLVREVDPELSTVTARDSRVDAVAWVFDTQDGTADLVVESVEQQTPDAVACVAASLARSLSKLHDRGIRKANIDGHVSDPHLGLVLARFPAVPREPLYLAEVNPDSVK